MKDVIDLNKAKEQISSKDIMAAVATHFFVALAGFAASRVTVFGSLLPFGLSFVGGCPSTFIPSAAIGVFIGYFIPSVGSGGFRYIAAMLAILAIKLMLSSYKKVIGNPLFLSFITLAASAITGAVVLNGQPITVINLAAEGLLSAGGTFFVCRTARAISHRQAGLSGDEMASLLIVISIVLMGLSEFELQGVSLSRILGVLLIVVSAKYGGTLSGAVSGISVSFAAALTGSSAAAYSFYAFGGMMAGIFAPLGRIAQVAAVIASGLIGCAINGFNATAALYIAEILIGCALFLLLPRGAGIILGKIFSCYPRVTTPVGVKRALNVRLNLAANALEEVSHTIDQVSRELSKINSPDFSEMISRVEADACVGCKLRVHCWESRRDSTVTAILDMTKAVRDGSSSPEEKAPEEFKCRCLRATRVGEAVGKRYSDYAARISAENRIDEVRQVVSDQFCGVSNMLCELAADFEGDEQFDNSAALNAASALKNMNIRTEECSARIDKFGRMTLELRIKKEPDIVLNKMQIMKLLSLACERDFDKPCINEVGSDIFLTLTEHAVLCADIGVHQFAASENAMCGDAYRCFNDGKGHYVTVLSDGMGTGGRAAVDGAMAAGLMAQLLKAGFGYECSLKILNSSMLFKSTDESLATLDIASVDLFTGDTEILKAGAAPTIVRRNGRSGKAESTSLPIGILRDIGFDRAVIRLKAGDILLSISDGVIGDGMDWIRAELETWREGSAQDLAEHIARGALRRSGEGRRDDITVIALILDKAI